MHHDFGEVAVAKEVQLGFIVFFHERGALEDQGEGDAGVRVLLDSARLWSAQGNHVIDSHGTDHSSLRANEKHRDTCMEAVLRFVDAASETADGIPARFGRTGANVQVSGDLGDVEMEGVEFEPDALELSNLQGFFLQFGRVVGQTIPGLEQLRVPVGEDIPFLLGQPMGSFYVQGLLDGRSERIFVRLQLVELRSSDEPYTPYCDIGRLRK